MTVKLRRRIFFITLPKAFDDEKMQEMIRSLYAQHLASFKHIFEIVRKMEKLLK